MFLRSQCLTGIVCAIMPLMFYSGSYAQSDCFIRTEQEFSLKSQPRTSATGTSLDYYDRIPWYQFGDLQLVDNECTMLNLHPGEKSEALMINNFDFDLPEASVIRGIEARMCGTTEGEGAISDFRIYLVDNEGRKVGQNKAHKYLKGYPFEQESSIYDFWSYGSEYDLWGHDWTAAMINSDNFGLSIELQNRDNKAVTAMLDQIIIKVYYEAPLDLCSDDNYLAVYADPDPSVIDYSWQLPAELNCELVPHLPFLVNVLTKGSQYGTYEICLSREYDDGYSETCCKAIEYRDCEKASIGDFVWHDLDGDGLQDADEPGIDNRRVYLYDESMVFLQEQISRDGFYRFDNLDPGSYFIKVAISDMQITQSVDGDEAMDSDFFEYLDEKMSRLINVAPGQHIDHVDFGFADRSTLEGLCWLDKNANGIFDSDDDILSDIEVQLLDANDEIVRATFSNANGMYKFAELDAADYKILFDIDSEFLPTQSGQDSDIIEDNSTDLFSLALNERLFKNGGFFRNAQITGMTWLDIDFDSNYGGDDQSLADITISLLDCSDQLIATTTTDASGLYAFTELRPGNYVLCADTDSEQFFIPKELSCTDCIEVSENTSLTDQDFIYNAASARLSVYLLYDYNLNQEKDNGEEAVSDLEVELFDCNGDFVSAGLTDADGLLDFEDIEAGEYYLSLLLPDNLSAADASYIDDKGLFTTDCFTYELDEMLIELPLLQLASIGDWVWHDKNSNGIQDEAEMGLESIDLELVDQNGEIIAQTSSDIDGFYAFNNLQPGDYYLQISELESLFTLTFENEGDEELDSDFYEDNTVLRTPTISLDYFDTELDIDLGLVAAATVSGMSVSGQLWKDSNGDLEQLDEQGLEGILVQLFNCDDELISSSITNAQGVYEFTGLIEGNYYISIDNPGDYNFELVDNGIIEGFDEDGISNCFELNDQDIITETAMVPLSEIGDFVWLDTNVDGQQDPDESGIEGLEIQLQDLDGNVIASFTTDLEGHYSFGGLTPGSYILEVIDDLESFWPTLQAMGDDVSDSELRLENDKLISELILLSDGMDNLDIDLGLNYRGSTLGGTVFIDENKDGIRNGIEGGMANVDVRLYNSRDELLQQTTTDVAGIYRFYNVALGAHYIVFETQDGFVFSPPDMGEDELFDSDILTQAGETSMIEIDEHKVFEGINAGMIRSSACVSGRYWSDEDRDGLIGLADGSMIALPSENKSLLGEEASVNDALVSILNEQNQVINSVFTNNRGEYVICDLKAGNYRLSFELISGFVFTEPNVGSDELLDSDVTSPQGFTDPLMIESGFSYNGINAGIYFDNNMPVEDTELSDLNNNDSETNTNRVAFDDWHSNASEVLVADQTDVQVSYELRKRGMNQNQFQSRIYPNPNGHGILYIEFVSPGVQMDVQYAIYDMQGRALLKSGKQLFNKKGKHVLTQSLADLPPSMYLLRIKLNEKTENHSLVIFSP